MKMNQRYRNTVRVQFEVECSGTKEDVLQLQPVWVFILDSVLPNNDGTSTHYYSTICVDALTGELY